jgi:hypothetical protein
MAINALAMCREVKAAQNALAAPRALIMPHEMPGIGDGRMTAAESRTRRGI